MYRLLWSLPLCLALEAAPPPHTALPAASVALVAVADDGSALPDAVGLERLARNDPIAFMDICLRRYDREVKGYRATLQKRERIEGKLMPVEVLDVQFREEPFSVILDWRRGARLAKKILFAKGENRDHLLVKPAGLAGLIGIVEREADGPEAKKSGRYLITQFGIKLGMLRTVAAWRNAQKHKALHITYEGIKPIKELNSRPCYVFKRTKYRAPEEDGVSDYTTHIDKETWLQTGSILNRVDGELIAEYYFRDIELNTSNKIDPFKREAFAK